MAYNLNDKQLIYGQLLMDGLTQHDAYKQAFAVKSDNRASIDSAASRLRKNEEFCRYMEDLQKSKIEKFKFTNFLNDEKKRELINERIDACRLRNDDTSIARYLDILNKMDGVYVNITKNIEEEKNEIMTLSNDELKQLINTIEQ